MTSFKGRAILVVEDEYLIALDIAQMLRERGAEVVGPVARLEDAIALVHKGTCIDGAVLDINLRGKKIYPLAEVLRNAGIPFVFATGYDLAAEGSTFADVARLEKPVDPDLVVHLLFP